MNEYIYQQPEWPHFIWQAERIEKLLGEVRHHQGRLLGRMDGVGFALQNEAVLQTITLDAVKSSEIEGEVLPRDQVRSSVARRLGLEAAGLPPASPQVEGVVEMLLDATQHADEELTAGRLLGWHAALFPTGRSGFYQVAAGLWRRDLTGPMQVVSGLPDREIVHFQAPPATQLLNETTQFLAWFNGANKLDPVLKAALAHLWFITLHPFEDGNGRLARALTDLQLARADGSPQRFYSMSAQIQRERQAYYTILERTQRGSLDVTPWLMWFLECLGRALSASDQTLAVVLRQANFWERHSAKPLNERRRRLLGRLLIGFEGNLTSTKWAKIAKCSQDTATRNIQSLITMGILIKKEAGGRSTSYQLLTE